MTYLEKYPKSLWKYSVLDDTGQQSNKVEEAAEVEVQSSGTNLSWR